MPENLSAETTSTVPVLGRDFDIDPVHKSLRPFDLPLIRDVWFEKYRWNLEESLSDTFARVVEGVYARDTSPDVGRHRLEAFRCMDQGLLMPGGRILAGAGTSKEVTLMNCYVNGTVEDSMKGIHAALGVTMLTLQQGGGIGTDFSTLRPKGAVLRRTGQGAAASGPLPFMDQWDATSRTIRSAGDRRGAMMATIIDSHPDLPDFIHAKQGNLNRRWEQFNVSVLVSDAFMLAVETDSDWYLHFDIPPAAPRPPELIVLDFDDSEGARQYVYSKWKARDLWNMITENTYKFSEPGVIFIDRVNDMNNLSYCEEIRCTNPCGEQPLPPYGACNLAAINLARIVQKPFTPSAKVDKKLLADVVSVAVRFLDNVIDVSKYPLPEQHREQVDKRRLGLGISGLADCLAQLGIRYGSAKSVQVTEDIMRFIAEAAYTESAILASERGVFPLFELGQIMQSPFIRQLSQETRDTIQDNGLRNGLLLTIAPTGTISLIYGNISSGLECTFLHEVNRRVLRKNNQWHEYGMVPSYAYRLYKAVFGEVAVANLPGYMVTVNDITIDDHLRIQAACQKWVDASVSKTINVPTETSFEDFQEVYLKAYNMGCKGCTTYRPNAQMDSILSAPSEPSTTSAPATSEGPNPDYIRTRPAYLEGATYKVTWPSWSSSVYITINHDETGRPFEVFLQSKDARHQEWITAMTIMISAFMRRQGDLTFIPEELKQVHSTHDTAWLNGKFYRSLVHRIGDVLEEHFIRIGLMVPEGVSASETVSANAVAPAEVPVIRGEVCPQCHAPALVREEGCYKCVSCAYTKCG